MFNKLSAYEKSPISELFAAIALSPHVSITFALLYTFAPAKQSNGILN
jgi:hypothetical protein